VHPVSVEARKDAGDGNRKGLPGREDAMTTTTIRSEVEPTPGPARSDDRQCPWVRRGVISHLTCYKGFDCGRCEVSQRIEDRLALDPDWLADAAPTEPQGAKLAA
jgi:hypothetical protein